MRPVPSIRSFGAVTFVLPLLLAACADNPTGLPEGSLAATGAELGQAPGQHRVNCTADGDVQFVCGPENPEDLAHVPQSPWVLVSTWQNDGYLSAAHFGTRETFEIYPGEAPQARQDMDLYGECPGPLTEGFYAHGISLRPGDDHVHTLFVVRHNAREAIEVFEVDGRGSRPTITWIGCVLPPEGEGLSFNSVVGLPDGGLAVTSPATNDVWEWQPGTGWAQVPGSVGGFPNGIEVSPDGQWYYIGAWLGQELIRLSRGQAVIEKSALPVGFRIDNVHIATDGSLLAAGHAATIQQVVDCLGLSVCEGYSSKVTKVAPDLSTAQEIFSYETNDLLPLGTAAIQVRNEFWIGGLRGERIAVIPAR